MSRHFRKPRRQSRLGLVVWIGLGVLQLCLALAEGVDAISRLLADLW